MLSSALLRLQNLLLTMSEMTTNRGGPTSLSPNDPLYKLIVNTPDFNSNPVGSVARNALVSKLKSSLPGRHSEMVRKGQRYVDIFYPNHSTAPYEEDVTAQTGLNDEWWSNFSTAVLCQSMYWQTSDIRRRLDINTINIDVDSYNSSLQEKAVQWYSHVLFLDFMKYSGDLGHAKEVYIDQISTDRWVTYKMKQYNDGTWANPEWEEFHHWVKLSALGASDDEIDGVIKKLRNLGLRIFPDVDVSTWRHYYLWCTPNTLDHKDVDDEARNGELRETCHIPIFTSGYPVHSCRKEGHCFEFIAKSQPGNKYRCSPSSSCFSSTTKVLLSDGSLKEIRDIKMGEVVQTPSGPRKVLLVSTPIRNERPLYGINKKSEFLFTATHPFLNSQQNSLTEPYFSAISPLELTHMVPMLSYKGIRKLGIGTCLVGFRSGSTHEEIVHSIEKFPPGLNDKLLYDLIVEPDITGKFEYIVGEKGSLFVVASELPTINNATCAELLASAVILGAISSASESLLALQNSTNMHLFQEGLTNVVHQLLYLLPLTSGLSSCSDSDVLSKITRSTEFIQYIRNKIELFVLSNGTYNPATGEAFAHISAHMAPQLAFTLQLGYRIIENTHPEWIAVSLGDLQITAPTLSSIFPDPVITIQVGELPEVKHKIEGNCMPFGIRIHKVFYIRLQELCKEYALNVCIKNADDPNEVLKCSIQIVFPLNHNYRHYRLPVFYNSQEEKGFLHVDIHLLSTASTKAEQMAACNWNEAKMCCFAEHLMKNAGEILVILCKDEIQKQKQVATPGT